MQTKGGYGSGTLALWGHVTCGQPSDCSGETGGRRNIIIIQNVITGRHVVNVGLLNCLITSTTRKIPIMCKQSV